MATNMQGKILAALEDLTPDGLQFVRNGEWANTGVIYYQDDNWDTVLMVRYDFQSKYATLDDASYRPLRKSIALLKYENGESIRNGLDKIRELLDARREYGY